jgi:hypothetical protein
LPAATRGESQQRTEAARRKRAALRDREEIGWEVRLHLPEAFIDHLSESTVRTIAAKMML